jgi:hypothetical protein
MNADPQPCTGNRYGTSVKKIHTDLFATFIYNFAIDFIDSMTRSCTGATGTNNQEDIRPNETSTHSLLCYVQNSRKMEDPDQHQTGKGQDPVTHLIKTLHSTGPAQQC